MIYLSKGPWGAGADSDHTWIRPWLKHFVNETYFGPVITVTVHGLIFESERFSMLCLNNNHSIDLNFKCQFDQCTLWMYTTKQF